MFDLLIFPYFSKFLSSPQLCCFNFFTFSNNLSTTMFIFPTVSMALPYNFYFQSKKKKNEFNFLNYFLTSHFKSSKIIKDPFP